MFQKLQQNLNQHKDQLKQFLLVLVMLITALSAFIGSTTETYAQVLPLPDKEKFGDLPAPPSGRAENQFAALVVTVLDNARYILGAVAIAMIVHAGLRIVLAQGNEDAITKHRQGIVWAIIGLALVGLSGEIVQILRVGCLPGETNCTPGGFLKDPNTIVRQSKLFSESTQLVITFIKYAIGAIAVLTVVRSGFTMITSGGDDDKISLQKKNLSYGLLGLFLIIIADTAISNVFYKLPVAPYSGTNGVQPGVDVQQGVREIIGFTNLLVSIVAPLAVIALVAAAIMYITAAGNEDQQGKAKRIIFAVVIGIIIMYGAFAIVSTFISGSFGSASTTQVTQPVNTGLP